MPVPNAYCTAPRSRTCPCTGRGFGFGGQCTRNGLPQPATRERGRRENADPVKGSSLRFLPGRTLARRLAAALFGLLLCVKLSL
jgi:hypothetical protein